MITQQPPPDLDALERAAWRNLHAAAAAHGVWRPQMIVGLNSMSRIVGAYCRMARTVAAQAEPPPPLFASELQEMRERIRDVMCNWFWIEPESTTPPLRPDGIDPDAARLCGMPEFGRGNA